MKCRPRPFQQGLEGSGIAQMAPLRAFPEGSGVGSFFPGHKKAPADAEAQLLPRMSYGCQALSAWRSTGACRVFRCSGSGLITARRVCAQKAESISSADPITRAVRAKLSSTAP